MEKNSSATVIRLDFRSNCSVPASADTVGNICPQLRLQRRWRVVSACRGRSWRGCTDCAQTWAPCGSRCPPSPCHWKQEQRPGRRFAGSGSGGRGDTNTAARADANTRPKWKNVYLMELLVQNCVSNLIVNKRCLNYHQCLAVAATVAKGMGRLGWYLPPRHRLEQ